MHRQLVLHIGLPKTATTTLQKHVFPSVPGYRGKHMPTVDQQWLDVVRSWSYQAPNLRTCCAAWATRIQHEAGDRVFVSEEELSGWPVLGNSAIWPIADGYADATRTGRHPVIPLLAMLRELFGDAWTVRVIFTVREQGCFLSSLYAQRDHRMLQPGQNDFVSKINSVVMTEDAFCDYASHVTELQQCVGRENLLVLVHEDGLVTNIERLEHFLDIDLTASKNSLPRLNAKSRGAGEWQAIRKVSLLQHGRLGRIRGAVLRRTPRPHTKVLGRLWDSTRRLERRVASTFPQRQLNGTKIVLEESLASAVRERFADSNAQLEALIGRDLRRAGW